PVGHVHAEQLVQREQRQYQAEEERACVHRAQQPALEDSPVELPEGIGLATPEKRQTRDQQVDEDGEVEESAGLGCLASSRKAQPVERNDQGRDQRSAEAGAEITAETPLERYGSG